MSGKSSSSSSSSSSNSGNSSTTTFTITTSSSIDRTKASLPALLSALLLLLLLLLPATTHAGIVWSDFVGGSFGDSKPKPRGIAANSAGYSCIGGRWNRDTATFAIGPYVFPQDPNVILYAGFVALKDPTGRLLWAQTFHSNSNTVYNVNIDERGNCYVAGTFLSETLTIGDASSKRHFVLRNFEPYNGSTISSFFTKLRRKDGSHLWATNLRVPATSIPYSLLLHKNAMYYVGYVSALDTNYVVNGKYQVGQFSLPACNGDFCMLLGKYNMRQDTWEWLQSYGGTSGDILLLWAGLSPKGDKLYVAGQGFAQGMQFGVITAGLAQRGLVQGRHRMLRVGVAGSIALNRRAACRPGCVPASTSPPRA